MVVRQIVDRAMFSLDASVIVPPEEAALPD
jgi:hypothetical protein